MDQGHGNIYRHNRSADNAAMSTRSNSDRRRQVAVRK